jgi:hypothetical protein
VGGDFAVDIDHEVAPNDFEMCRPDESTERRLGRAIREMTAIVEEILLDPALAVEAPWNDWQGRAGWTQERRSKAEKQHDDQLTPA